jgi:hypothetical protein
MTQTIAIGGTKPEINPLYIKLRRRFACQGDRTIGEVKAQEAIRDGYEPYATTVRRSTCSQKSSMERHVTHANALPSENAKKRVAVRQSGISGSAITILVLCAVLLLFLLFSGIRISELNNELSGMQDSANELRAEDRDLTLSVADIDRFAAEGASNDSDTMDKISSSNLHRAFSGE